MADQSKDLSDTGKRLEAVREELDELRDDMHRRDTPVMVAQHSGESSERMSRIAEKEAALIAGELRLEIAKHAADCKGLSELKQKLHEVKESQEKRMGEITAKQEGYDHMIERIAGAVGLSKVLVPLSAAVVIITTVVKFYLEMKGLR